MILVLKSRLAGSRSVRLGLVLGSVLGLVLGASLTLGACGSDAPATSNAATSNAATSDRGGQLTIIATTTVLGDVVQELVGDQFTVTSLMPSGTDPHDFAPSAQQVAALGDAAAVIANGAGFEVGLVDVLESAEGDGAAIFEAISVVTTIEFGTDEDHDDEDHDEHGHEGVDPHFFTDPARMAAAAQGIVDFLIETVPDVDADALGVSADAYIEALHALDTETEKILDVIDPEHRVLITNHEVFGYFAERYDFEVAGTVIPSGSTADGANANEMARLAEVIEHEGVPAIFADTSASDALAETLAAEVGDIEIVSLFSESLGTSDSEGATYIDMVRTNAQRIAGALAG